MGLVTEAQREAALSEWRARTENKKSKDRYFLNKWLLLNKKY
jgi:hypothetical protein